MRSIFNKINEILLVEKLQLCGVIIRDKNKLINKI